jgi:hypothetical protein
MTNLSRDIKGFFPAEIWSWRFLLPTFVMLEAGFNPLKFEHSTWGCGWFTVFVNHEPFEHVFWVYSIFSLLAYTIYVRWWSPHFVLLRHPLVLVAPPFLLLENWLFHSWWRVFHRYSEYMHYGTMYHLCIYVSCTFALNILWYLHLPKRNDHQVGLAMNIHEYL